MGFFSAGRFPGGQAGHGFNPLIIPDLSAGHWYEADSGITLASGAVSTWTDRTGNVNLTQATAANRPTYTLPDGGYASLSFDGSNDRLFAANSNVLSNRAGAYFAVVVERTDDASSGAGYAMALAISANTNERAYLSWGGSDLLTVGGRRQDADSLQSVSSKTYLSRGRTYVLSFALDYANAKISSWINGQPEVIEDTFQTAGNSQTIGQQGPSIGGRNGGSSFFTGKIRQVIIVPRLLNATERQYLEGGLAKHYQLPSWWTARNWLVFDGTSTFFGTGITLGKNRIPNQVHAQLGHPIGTVFYNDAVAGQSFPTMESGATGTNGIDSLSAPPNAQKILVVQGGSNDISLGGSASDVFDLYRTYIQNRAAAGFEKIVVVPPQPRTDTDISDRILALGQLMRDNWSTLQSDGATALADIHQLPQFNNNLAWQDATYYQADTVHCKEAGITLIAQTIANTITNAGLLV